MIPTPGRWSLAREICDRRAHLTGWMTGELEISRNEDGYLWDETGTLHWAGATSVVFRHLLLRRRFDQAGQSAGEWWIDFADGRPFHPWRPGQVVDHLCRNDLYQGRIDLRGHEMLTVWDVRGPAKDQHLVTRLELLSS